MMSQIDMLVALADIEVNRTELLAIQQNELVPLLQDQYRLNHYADSAIQAQSVLLNGIDPHLIQQLGSSIEQLIQALADLKKYLGSRQFTALQKWLGVDLEYSSMQVEYYKKLDQFLNRAHHLSQKLQVEILKSEARFQQLLRHREQMAKYIRAAQEFLLEYPDYLRNAQPLDHFAESLSKKIHSLQTLQASNDIAITQMQLSQQLAFTLLDRFKEAQQVQIPAWQDHVKRSHQHDSGIELDKLAHSREELMHTLRKSLEKPIP